jgi:hypothetical protein
MDVGVHTGTGDGTSDGSLSLLGAVLDALSGEVSGTALGCLKDNGALGVACGFEGSNTGEGNIR